MWLETYQSQQIILISSNHMLTGVKNCKRVGSITFFKKKEEEINK